MSLNNKQKMKSLAKDMNACLKRMARERDKMQRLKAEAVEYSDSFTKGVKEIEDGINKISEGLK